MYRVKCTSVNATLEINFWISKLLKSVSHWIIYIRNQTILMDVIDYFVKWATVYWHWKWVQSQINVERIKILPPSESFLNKMNHTSGRLIFSALTKVYVRSDTNRTTVFDQLSSIKVLFDLRSAKLVRLPDYDKWTYTYLYHEWR